VGSVQDSGEDISNTNMSERVLRHQPKNEPNALSSSGNNLKPQSSQSITKWFSQDKQAEKKMRFTLHNGSPEHNWESYYPNFAGLVSFGPGTSLNSPHRE